MRYVVDTHALLWYLQNHVRLGENAKRILADRTSQLVIPAIVLVEACWIVESGKTFIKSPADLMRAVSRDPRFEFIPLDRPVIEISLSLTMINEIHDRQIVATTLWLQRTRPDIVLITHDRMITATGVVPVIW